jgi:hypothetical protein
MVLLFLGLVMFTEGNLESALLSTEELMLQSSPELRTFNHPNRWHFRGLQHPCNLVEAFVLTKSNMGEVIDIQLHPRTRTNFSGGCRNSLINQRWYARSSVITLKT